MQYFVKQELGEVYNILNQQTNPTICSNLKAKQLSEVSKLTCMKIQGKFQFMSDLFSGLILKTAINLNFIILTIRLKQMKNAIWSQQV